MNIDPDLSEQEQQEFAALIARRLESLARGDPAEPETWRRVAQKLGCRVDIYRDPDGSYGTYAPNPETPGAGLITYNTSQPKRTQARVLVDLLSHHLRHWWIPDEAPGER